MDVKGAAIIMNGRNTYRCPGCMKPLADNNALCSCGFNIGTYRPNPRCLRPGTVLYNNKYVVGKVLGEGGFGITYIGWNTTLEMPVAIKEYFPQSIASRDNNTRILSVFNTKVDIFVDGMRRTLNEARTMSKMERFPGIVSIYDFFNENNTAYITMEYVDGITLKEHVKNNGTMDYHSVLDIMKPVMQALDKMHSLKMIHRDISPDNIMIRNDGQIKLIDFGSTRIIEEDNEKSLTVMLKRGFTPEEQYRSKGNQGSWTDVYALCATMYYMITGQVIPEAMDRLVDDTYISIGNQGIPIDKYVIEAIDKGLAVRAGDRIKTMRELMSYLYDGKRMVADIPKTELDYPVSSEVSDKPLPVSDYPEDKKKTGGAVKKIIVAAVAAIVVIAGGVLYVLGSNGDSDDKAIQVTQNDVNSVKNADGTGNVVETTAEPETVAATEIPVDVAVTETPVDIAATGTPVLPDDNPVQPAVTDAPSVSVAKVPDVTKMKLSKAKNKLRKLDLKWEVTKEHSSSVKKGYVISQSIDKGVQVVTGTTIKLTVSKGKVPATPTPEPEYNRPVTTWKPQVKTTPKPKAKATAKPKKKKNDISIKPIDDDDDMVVLN